MKGYFFDEFQRELIVENTSQVTSWRKHWETGCGRPKAMNEQSIKYAEAMLKDAERNYPS
ncbi:hypothetical protein [Arsenophonus endosymbiont of Bemisia tabaci]|uniref:hypothetical protein n=1 Tax=Arsenophonus endosymbiont of Bemisia tabaci TaxID=536059 RepID=UPI00192D8E12|nr:hypothetical protein [Arsenophonus endosymbiont of Bemisia tabaci]